MKRLKKIVYFIFIFLITSLLSGVIATIIYKDEIVNLLIVEVNKNIKTELKVDNIELKIFKGFPNISIDFQGVKFQSAIKNEPLLESKNVYFVLNVLELLNNKISIDRLEIVDAQVKIHINKKGQQNFNVFVSSDTSKTDLSSLRIKSISLKNVSVVTSFDKENISSTSFIKSLKGELFVDDQLSNVRLLSSLVLKKTNQKSIKWLIGKQIQLDTKNLITDNKVHISKSTITLGSMQLKVDGTIGFKSKTIIDLNLQTSNLTYKHLFSVIPVGISEKLIPYDGKGIIDIKSNITGDLSVNGILGMNAVIGLKDFNLNHKEFLHPIENINVVCDLKIKNIRKLNTASLNYTGMTASINNYKIVTSLQLSNFITPEVSGNIVGDLEVSWVSGILGLKRANSVYKGELDVNMRANLKLNSSYKIKSRMFSGKVGFNEVEVDSILGLNLTKLNGDIVFDQKRISIQKISAHFGLSDLILDGEILIPVDKTQRILSNIKVKSEHVNLDELFRALTLSKDSTTKKTSSSLKYTATLDLKLKSLHFLKFKGKNLDVKLTIDEKNVQINSSYANALGGNIKFSGVGAKQFNGDYYIEANTQTSKIFLDSLFYVFGNFKQSFITSRAIKGKLDAKIYTYMYFDSNWNIKRDLLYADALLRVKDGELINYAPVMSLASHLNEKGENLAQLKFSNLENHIVVANDTVFISEMYVGTNIRNIKIGGYHTLNQDIDYRLAVPVINSNKDSDSQFGRVKKDNKGQLYFPFRVFGTTTDYKVVYDLKKASSNLFKGIKEIVKKPKPELLIDTLKLEEDEYFDWDNK